MTTKETNAQPGETEVGVRNKQRQRGNASGDEGESSVSVSRTYKTAAVVGVPLLAFIAWRVLATFVPALDASSFIFGNTSLSNDVYDLPSYKINMDEAGFKGKDNDQFTSLPKFDPVMPARECKFISAEAVAARRATLPTFRDGKPRICLLTFASNLSPELRNATLTNKKEYASHHGYDLLIGDAEIDPSRPAPWSKLTILQRHLSDYDYMVWSDADAIFMNMSIAIEDLVDGSHELFFAEDGASINSGVFIIHNSEWSLWWLKECWDQTWLVTGHHPFLYEQRAMQYLYGTRDLTNDARRNRRPPYPKVSEVRAKTGLVEACALNTNICFGQSGHSPVDRCRPWHYADGLFVVHFAGVFPREWRYEQMQKALVVAEARNKASPMPEDSKTKVLPSEDAIVHVTRQQRGETPTKIGDTSVVAIDKTNPVDLLPKFDPVMPARECKFISAEAVAARRATLPTFRDGKPRICLLTFASNLSPELRNATLTNKKEYASHHGYDLLIGDAEIDPSRPAPWSKLTILQRHLSDYDYMVWSDADAIFMNMSIAIEDLVDGSHELFFAEDGASINSGVFIIHNSEWSLWWLKECWDQTWLVTGHHPFLYEQRAMQYLYGTRDLTNDARRNRRPPYPKVSEVRAKTGLVEACALNTNICFGQSGHSPVDRCRPWHYADGLFVVHFAGVFPREWRYEQMQKALVVAEARNKDQFEKSGHV